MKLNKNVILGIKTIALLKEEAEPRTTRDLAKKVGTTIGFLEQIMRDLREAGLVSSKQGPGGGYIVNGARLPMTALDVAVACGQVLQVKSKEISASDRLNNAIIDAFLNTKI